MNTDVNGSILKEYDEKRSSYAYICQSAAALIGRLLDSKGIVVHSVTFRCKERKSLEGKLKKKEKYRSLADVTDLAGVRIITHYQDDVDAVAALIKREFLIDKENSIDKRLAGDPDRFGYASLHYVASISKSRAKLQEYSEISSLKFEFQIRSILQHAWAEIEHDVGYKSELEVPVPIRRKFSRLAGLLELADLEFSSIRKDIERYSRKVGRDISLGQLDIPLDIVSYRAFIKSNELSLGVDNLICERTNHVLRADSADQKDHSQQIKRLALFGIKNVGNLSALIARNSEAVCDLAEDVCSLKQFEHSESNVFGVGVACFYLCHLLAARSEEPILLEYLDMNGWLDSGPSNDEFIQVLRKHH